MVHEGKRVIVVEDHQELRSALRALFELLQEVVGGRFPLPAKAAPTASARRRGE
jgi:hypothetical protein